MITMILNDTMIYAKNN